MHPSSRQISPVWALCNDSDRMTVQALERPRVHHLIPRADLVVAVTEQQQQMIAKAHGEIDVMQNHQHRGLAPPSAFAD